MDSVGYQSRLRRLKPALEGLETRSLLSAALPDIAMVSATTSDSTSVTFDYDIQGAAVNQPIQFEIYRSATSQPGPDAQTVARWWSTRRKGRDHPRSEREPGDGGRCARDSRSRFPAGCHHSLRSRTWWSRPTRPAPWPRRTPRTTRRRSAPMSSASITHGGVQPKSWKVGGPPWEQQMAAIAQGPGLRRGDPVQLGRREQHRRRRGPAGAPAGQDDPGERRASSPPAP